MIRIKNLRPGILFITDAGLKLKPGETVEVETLSKHAEGLVKSGRLARLDEAAVPKTEKAHDLAKLSAQQAIEAVGDLKDPEQIQNLLEVEKRRSVLEALDKKRREVTGGTD